jgi:hypothetical protein
MSLDDLGAPWLTSALQRAWPGARVAGATVTRVVHGTATGCRVSLRYAGPEDGPATVWLKSGWEPHSPYLFGTGTYRTEASFYADLRHELPVAAPECYFAAFDGGAPQFVVLLEDLEARGVEWAVPGGVAPDRARAALEALAALHGRWWQSSALGRYDWLQSTVTGGVAEHYRSRDASVLRQVLQRPRADAMAPALRDAARLAAAYRSLLQPGDGPTCLVHGDAHAGNAYFDPHGAPGFVDWQGTKRAPWAWDVAQFLVSALAIGDRREHEQGLLTSYLDRLATSGGPAIPYDVAWRAYCRHLVYPLVGWLCTGYQPEDVCAANVARFAAAAADHDVLSA